MRKQAQDQRNKNKASISPSSSFSNSSSNSSANSPTVDSMPVNEQNERNSNDGLEHLQLAAGENKVHDHESGEKNMMVYSLDEIWKDVESSQDTDQTMNKLPVMASPLWDYCPDSLWMTDYYYDNQDISFFRG